MFSLHARIRGAPCGSQPPKGASTWSWPVWAAGGMSTPRAVRDALAAGAEPAVVGTALLAVRGERAHRAGLQVSIGKDPARTVTLLTTVLCGRAGRGRCATNWVEYFHIRREPPWAYPAWTISRARPGKLPLQLCTQENISVWPGAGPPRRRPTNPRRSSCGACAGLIQKPNTPPWERGRPLASGTQSLSFRCLSSPCCARAISSVTLARDPQGKKSFWPIQPALQSWVCYGLI